jgi:hypothetical protein
MNYPISGEYGSSSEGTLQLSANGHYLSVMGYGINPDTYNSSPQTYGPYLSGSTPYYAEAQSTSVPGNPICGPAGSAGTSACTAIPRVLALISANGTVDTSTALTNVFDQQNPRSAYVDGSLIYIAGQGSSGDATGGVFYTTLGSTGNTAVPITGLDSTYSGAASSQDAREVQVYGGQLYMSLDNKSDSPGRAFVGTLGTTGALPTSLANSGNGPTALPGFAGTTSKPQEAVVTLTTANENTIDASGNQTGKTADLSPYNYFFANATTLYIADGGNPKGNAGSSSYGLGGLQKWTYNGTTWQLLYTLSVGLNLVKYNASTGTTGLYGLAGKVIPGGQVELFATNATAADEDQTYLYGIVDTLSNTTPPGTNEAFTVLATAPANCNFKGVAFAPTISKLAPDLNADGNSDLLWYNSNSGQTVGWLMNGVGLSSQALLYTDPYWKILLYADFNGDGNTDQLWYNSKTGQTVIWLMNGLSYISQTLIYTDATPGGWKPIATADLNGDGMADLVWYNSNTGQTVGWLMNGATVTSQALLYTDPYWQVIAAADFNGDGQADLLWYNSNTGQTVIWLMNGLGYISQTLIYTDATKGGWKPIATADLNGDGLADLLWYNSNTGQTVGWLMNGATVTSQALLYTDVSGGWQVTAPADFNGDGMADLLWHNPTTGQTVIWLMNGLSVTTNALIYTDPNLIYWNVTATPDLNGDGKADLIWYNNNTGQTAGWLMNGATPTNEALLYTDASIGGWTTTNYFNGLVIAPGNY